MSCWDNDRLSSPTTWGEPALSVTIIAHQPTCFSANVTLICESSAWSTGIKPFRAPSSWLAGPPLRSWKHSFLLSRFLCSAFASISSVHDIVACSLLYVKHMLRGPTHHYYSYILPCLPILYTRQYSSWIPPPAQIQQSGNRGRKSEIHSYTPPSLYTLG